MNDRWLLPLLLLCAGSISAADKAAAKKEAAKSPDNLSFDGARTETYKTIGDVTLKIHIFEPVGHKPTDKSPAIVCFFGGGWKGGLPSQFEQQCRYLATRGTVAMTADYRVASRQGTLAKECVQDAKSAIRWVRTNAARLGVDPDRIVASGGSAGGHIAACTGILEGWDEPGEPTTVSAKPNAMVLFNPAAALAPIDGSEPLPEKEAAALKARMGTDPINLSPAHQVHPGAPPTIEFFGADDKLAAGGKALAKRMQEEGNRCELKLYEGHVHGFFNYGKNDNVPFADTLKETDKFLASLGYLQGPPQVDEWMKGIK